MNELKKKGFDSFNKNVRLWNVCKDLFRIERLPLDLRMQKVFVFFFFTLGKSGSEGNMMFLTKETTDKDRSLKTQLLISTNKSNDKLSGERV